MPHFMNILLQRGDASIPWGFRIRRENGNGVPFVVQRVTPGTIASNYLQPGDVIMELSNRPAHELLHENIDEIIKAAGNSLELIIRKRPPGSSSSPTPGTPGTPAVGTPMRFSPTSSVRMNSDLSSPLAATPTHTPPPPLYSSSSPKPYSPVASPRSSMISPAPDSASPPFPSPPLPLPPSPLTSPAAPTGFSPPTPPPPPPPPPLPSADQITVPWRTKRTNPPEMVSRPSVFNTPQGPPSSNVQQYEHLPAALQSSLLKDKKPFTYTPGGLDLSELRSPRMQRRIHYNQQDPPRNLARVPPPTQEQDVGSKIMSPPPPETYPQPRVQLFPTVQPQSTTPRSQPAPSGPPLFLQNRHQKQQQEQHSPVHQPPAQPKNQTPEPIQQPQVQVQQNQQQPQQADQQQSPTPKQAQQPQRPKPQEQQQILSPTFAPSTYNSPLHLYSTENAAEAYHNQTGKDLPGLQKVPANKGTPQHRRSVEEENFTPYYKGQQPQSRSFRLLQVMTDTTSPDAEESVTSPRTPTRTEDDEMKFSGLRRNPIPSRAFQTLQRITGEENGHAAPAQIPLSNAASESNAGVAEPELRYRGAYIPSRSFKILQEMTGGSDDDVLVSPRSTLPRVKKTAVINMQIGNGAERIISSPNANSTANLPPSEQKVEAEPKKYMGAYIPSRSFRLLQVMTGSDDSLDSASDSYSPSVNSDHAQTEPAPRMYMGGNIPSRSFRLLQAMTDPDRIGTLSSPSK